MVRHWGLWDEVDECWFCSLDGIVFATDSLVIAAVQRTIANSMGRDNLTIEGKWVIRDMETWLRED